MQPVLRRRRQAWATLRSELGSNLDPGRHYLCADGSPNDQDPYCPPMRPDLGAPEIQLCGYKNAERRAVWLNICAHFTQGGPGYSAGGSWPPEPVPTDLADPYGPPPSGPGARGGGALACPLGFYWDSATQQCLEYEHPSCWEGTVWDWERYECVSTAGGSYPAPGPRMARLARRPSRMGHYRRSHPMTGITHGASSNPYRTPRKGQFFGSSNPLRRASARQISAQADAKHGFSAGYANSAPGGGSESGPHMHGQRVNGGRGWIRTTPLLDLGVTPAAAKSALGVRRYNRMARERMRAGYSAGGLHDGGGGTAYGYPPGVGVFYGSQNPVRKAESMRQNPTGWQNGFAIGKGCKTC